MKETMLVVKKLDALGVDFNTQIAAFKIENAGFSCHAFSCRYVFIP